MDARTLEVLEYPAVIERLARRTSFSAGREAALALLPVTDRDIVVRRQRETGEAVRLERLGIDVPLGGAHDVRERARAAARGMVLPANDLLDIASTAHAAGRVARVLARVTGNAPLLAVIGAGIADLGPLRQLIEGALDDRGEVRDDASPELRQIRREVTEAHDRLQQRMQTLLGSPAIRGALQESIITQRDGRYVFPVKAESRSAVRGVVHDTSASGATVYVEPLPVVELGNRWRELRVQERHEVERILREISEAVGQAAEDVVDAIDRLARVDVALAKARLAAELDARDLAEGAAEGRWLLETPAQLRLVEARHPLLEGDVVPISLHVGGEDRALLITGPNTGGKTVALKTAGLLCLMALAGLPVPAREGTRIPVYDAVFADIGDEQSIEQSLSTFSGHMTAIIDIIERAGAGSLVLLDELGAGTDPTEGAALGVALVDRLVEAGASLIATTHHSELKLYAHRTPAVTNASVEFDLETLSPTYRLTIGLPGQSNALAIASNLGMPAGVIDAAREGLSSEQRDMEGLLADLRSQLAAAEERAQRAAIDAAHAETLRADLERRLDELAAETTRMRDEARARVRTELRDVERYLEKTRREVEAARLDQARADLQRARTAAKVLEPEPPTPEERAWEPSRRSAPAALVDEPVAAGSVVWLRGISMPGEVLSDIDDHGEFDVQLGALHTRVRLEQVERTGSREELPAAGGSGQHLPAPPPLAPEEIEVRGRRLDEALPEIEDFLDRAARSGRARVRLIHGKGTGTLRRAVRELLARHPLVTSYEAGVPQEGGDGVTVVYLASVR
ncbi:MAG: endonuclease MutS2 [Dehalococcoidia bacterium]|nr:endonuclease MutS2 [Dehalococcoidia bacterium]